MNCEYTTVQKWIFHLYPCMLPIISLSTCRLGVWKALTRRRFPLCWTQPVTLWWQMSKSYRPQFRFYTGWHHHLIWETGWVNKKRENAVFTKCFLMFQMQMKANTKIKLSTFFGSYIYSVFSVPYVSKNGIVEVWECRQLVHFKSVI